MLILMILKIHVNDYIMEIFKAKSSRGPERLELACFSPTEQAEGLSCFSLAVPKPESPGYGNFESSQ